MRRRKKKASSDFVEPDLPITPMLDMSFQLLAFFITTFNPSPSEGHLDMSLPKLEGGSATEITSTFEDDADELVVTVDADPNGGIGQIRWRMKDDAEGRPLGPDSKVLFDTLKRRIDVEKKKAGKIKLELADALQYKMVIKLMDEITRAGYKQVAPALHAAKK